MELSPASAFGKVPWEGDFVRASSGDSSWTAMVEYLERSNDRQRADAAELSWARFVVVPAEGLPPVAGATRASRDRVNRSFPLSVWATVVRGPAAGPWMTPLSLGSWLEAADALLVAAAAGPLALPTRVSELERRPAESQGQAAALTADAAETLTAMFGDLASGQYLYGLQTFLAALEARDVSALCPARSEIHLQFWLELARRKAPSGAPSVLWNETFALVSKGHVSPAAFAALAQPSKDISRIWPLTTPSDPAREAARKALPAVAQLERTPCRLEALIDVLCSTGRTL